MPEGQPDNPEILIQAAENGQLDEVQRLMVEMAGFLHLDIYSFEAMLAAAANGHLEIVDYLLGFSCVNLSHEANNALIGAVENGHFEVVERLLDWDRVNPGAQDSEAIILAARRGHLEIVERLLRCERVNPADRESAAIRVAIQRGHLEIVRALLTDGRVTVTSNDINLASLRGHTEIVVLLEEHLLKSPKEQMAQLIGAHESVLSYERRGGLSGRESSMDVYLERQAEQQRALLSERYAEESLSSGQRLLRELVFRALQSHIESNAPEAEDKLRFLSAHMDDLIAGDAESLSGAAALFNSNEDMYEIASRALNAQAPSVRWSNLLTAEGENGEWVQSYAGNVAREIAASEGQPHYDTCLYALIYRLAEIRRAHNEGDVMGTDNPSCFPGTKTRLLKVLGTHPAHQEHVRAVWKAACYEGAVRHIEQVFGQVLDDMDSPEEAEQLLDALLMMRLENREAIESGEALLAVRGDRQVYAEEHCKKRYALILKIREGLQESVNDYLCEQGLEPISEWGRRAVYLHFLEKALGEDWIGSRLSSVYLQHAPKAASEEVLQAAPAQPVSLRMAQALQRQALQGLKRRFYEHCEQHHPEIEVSAGQVNTFFAGVEIPAGADETALFEDAFEQLASGESNEGRQSPSP